MGRKAKPVGLLLLQGKKHLTKAEIDQRTKAEQSLKPGTDKIRPPSFLDDKGRKEWNRVVKELKALDLITNLDVVALAMYCDAYSKYVTATEDIKKNGLTIIHKNTAGFENRVANPAIQTSQKYAQQILKFCTEFGLTPSSRLRLVVPEKEQKKQTEFEKKFGDV